MLRLIDPGAASGLQYGNKAIFDFFLFTARCHASAVYAVVMYLCVCVCLSVCLSQVGVLKRLNVGSLKHRCTIAQGL